MLPIFKCLVAILSLWLCSYFEVSVGQNFEQFAQKVGSSFCMYLAYKSILPRKYFNQCGPPTCGWDDWQDALHQNTASKLGSAQNQKIVVSYSHNGFGNQLWEHSVAFMVAEALKARLLIAIIPDSLSPGGFIPPNTWSGMSAMERLLPTEFLYESLPTDSPIRSLCDNEPFFASDRPYDWRSKNYSQNFRPQLYDILSDTKPRCLKLLGYFQNLPLCQDDARRLWTDKLVANFTMRPGDNDISIYLRCIPRHYHFNNVQFYESILNHTKFDRIWLFQAPECPNKLSDNPAKDSLVTSVVRLLRERFNATRWPSYEGPDDTTALLHDLAGLAMSKKLILPLSSWAFWAGMFSNATEIHVNAPPLHPLMPHNSQYIYHDEKNRMYFGKYNASANDIEYEIKPDTEWTPSMAQRLRNRGQLSSSNHQHHNGSLSDGNGHHGTHHHRGGSSGSGKHGHGKGHGKAHGHASHSGEHHGGATSHSSGSSSINTTTIGTVSTEIAASTSTVVASAPPNFLNFSMNATATLQILKGKSIIDTFTHFLSTLNMASSLRIAGLNQSWINQHGISLMKTGTTPAWSSSLRFDVKATVTIALCHGSVLLETYSFVSNSVDDRETILAEESASTDGVVINKDKVIDIAQVLTQKSALIYS